MRLTILGSGTAVPHPSRTSAAHWIETSNGKLMLDFSASAPFRMAEERLDWVNLDSIWISHFHLDHVGGLAPFLFGTRHAPAIQKRTKALNIFGPVGLKLLLEGFAAIGPYKLFKQPFPVSVKEVLPSEEFEIAQGIRATTCKTPHTKESLALRISSDGKSLVYTSDTGYSDELAPFALNTDLLLIECSFFRDKPATSHLELQEAMLIAEQSAARKVVLVHLYPEWDGIDVEGEARKLSSRSIIEGHDGLTISV